MMQHGMNDADRQEYADQIQEALVASRQQRRAPRRAFGERVSDFLLSIPAGIAVRLGG
jgi:hypothetical protein